MTKAQISVVILAAGHGTRMKSSLPKVLHDIGGAAMLHHAITSADSLAPTKKVLILGEDANQIESAAKKWAPEIEIAIQAPARGTGDAVAKAAPALEKFAGTVLVLYADTPLVTSATLQTLCNEIKAGAAVSVLGFRTDMPGAYGRLKLSGNGDLERIIEAKDANPEELLIDLCNSGVMAIDSEFLADALPKIDNNNAKKEYYLTDLIAIATSEGKRAGVIEASEEEVLGVNSRAELAVAEEIFQDRARLAAMDGGATLRDPSTTYFSFDTKIGRDVTIGQQVVFGPGVEIADGAEIKAFSHLEGASVGADAAVGPFARLRPGADLGRDAKVGNFVEIKKAKIGAGAKVSHLTYIGDATIGARANIGAGTITCNYDGVDKHLTQICDDAFIGSNAALVAPITIGEGAYVGSGSVITKDVPAGSLAVSRTRQKIVEGWAARFQKSKKPK